MIIVFSVAHLIIAAVIAFYVFLMGYRVGFSGGKKDQLHVTMQMPKGFEIKFKDGTIIESLH